MRSDPDSAAAGNNGTGSIEQRWHLRDATGNGDFEGRH